MSKKKFTQDIADILADDLATLESIEPGAILRPELMKKPSEAKPAEVSGLEVQSEVAAPPPPEVVAPDDQPPAAEREPAAEAVVAEAKLVVASEAEPVAAVVVTDVETFAVAAIPGAAVDDTESDAGQPPLPLVDASDVDQPDLFAAPVEAPVSLPAAPVPTAPQRRRRARRARKRQAAEQAREASTETPGPEPTVAAAPEVVPEPAPGPDSESNPEPTRGSEREVEPVPAPRNPRDHQESAGGGSGSDFNPDRGGDGGQQFNDSVTLLEITPPEDGGIRERALPGDRSLSPPSPPKARRAWNHPVARWTFYVLVVVALTAIFLFLLVELFHLG